MDNRKQDLHIYNWKNHGTSIMRELEIIQIIFTKTEIIIDFIKSTTRMQMIIEKRYNSITID